LIHEREKLLISNITLSIGNSDLMPITGARNTAGKNPPPTPIKPLIAAVTKATHITYASSKLSNLGADLSTRELVIDDQSYRVLFL